MHKFLVILVFASAIASSSAMAQDAGIIPPTVPPAPESEQRRLSSFDAEQHKLDEMLDKKLNICRC
jgi:hypothetical protein